MIDMETRQVLRALERRIKDLERQLGKQATREPVGASEFRIPVYAIPAALPLTGNTVPSLAYVTSTSTLYVWTGQWEPMNRLVDVTP